MVLWIIIPMALVFAALGAAVKYLKCYWLIAGYNTMPRHKKEKVDAAGLGNFLGNWLFALAGLLLAGGILSRLGLIYADLIGWAIFYGAVLYMLMGAQRFDHNPRTKSDRIVLSLVFGSLAVIGLAVFIFIFLGSLSPKSQIEEGYLKIDGFYGLNLPLSEIKEISLEDKMPPVMNKANGFDAGPVKKGAFEVEGLGRGRLLIHSPRGPFIFIFTSDSFVIINFKDPERTGKLYEELSSELGRETSGFRPSVQNSRGEPRKISPLPG